MKTMASEIKPGDTILVGGVPMQVEADLSFGSRELRDEVHVRFTNGTRGLFRTFQTIEIVAEKATEGES